MKVSLTLAACIIGAFEGVPWWAAIPLCVFVLLLVGRTGTAPMREAIVRAGIEDFLFAVCNRRTADAGFAALLAYAFGALLRLAVSSV